uniref:Dysbindin domain-containing protein 1 n=2 Tax=Charadriiformes TaxID=8906 RepID=A0A8C3KST8_9CHAR
PNECLKSVTAAPGAASTGSLPKSRAGQAGAGRAPPPSAARIPRLQRTLQQQVQSPPKPPRGSLSFPRPPVPAQAQAQPQPRPRSHHGGCRWRRGLQATGARISREVRGGRTRPLATRRSALATAAGPASGRGGGPGRGVPTVPGPDTPPHPRAHRCGPRSPVLPRPRFPHLGSPSAPAPSRDPAARPGSPAAPPVPAGPPSGLLCTPDLCGRVCPPTGSPPCLPPLGPALPGSFSAPPPPVPGGRRGRSRSPPTRLPAPLPAFAPPPAPPPPRRAGACGLRAGTGPAPPSTGSGTGTGSGPARPMEAPGATGTLEPLSSVSSLEVHFDLLDLTELTDMSDQELAEVFADSDEENVAGESPSGLQPQVVPRAGYLRSPSWTRAREQGREKKHLSDPELPPGPPDAFLPAERPREP